MPKQFGQELFWCAFGITLKPLRGAQNALIFVLMGLHGLFVGFLGRAGSGMGGFPVVSTSAGKVENSVPGALRPKRSVN
jgi:hypothetical protein